MFFELAGKMERVLGSPAVYIKAISTEEIREWREDEERRIWFRRDIDELWREWGECRISYENAVRSGMDVDEKVSFDLHELEEEILSRKAKGLSGSFDHRFDDFLTPFQFRVIHAPGEHVLFHLDVPPHSVQQGVSDWKKYFLDPDDTETLLDDLSGFSESEIEAAIEEGADRLKEYVIIAGKKDLEDWEVEKKRTFYDRLVENCLYFNWQYYPVKEAFDPFIDEFTSLDKSKLSAFLKRQYTERVAQLLYFAKKTDNKYADLGECGFINAIEQEFLGQLIEHAEDRRGIPRED